MRMGKFLAVVLTACLLTTGFAVSASAAPMKRFSSCAALLKEFPAGVAKDKRSAARAVQAGNRRPVVRPEIFRVNASRLDRDKDGVACEQARQSAPAPQPEVVPPGPPPPLPNY